MPLLRFVVPRLPAGTPPGRLFLTGGHRAWADDPAGWTFTRTPLEDGGETATLEAEIPTGTLLNVKVRLEPHGGGATLEEGDAWGGRAPAHKAVVGATPAEVPLPQEGWQDDRAGAGRQGQAQPPREEWTLPAPWGEQEVRVWWPQGHDRTTGPLPLLLMHDGQNVFDEGPTFAGQSWNVGAAAQALADEGHPCRIVALSVNEERSRRYVPFPFVLNDHVPGADGYLDWIEGTLLPELAARYGAVPAERRGMAGSSFGGLITLYGGLRHAELFGTLGVFSPAIWPADFALLRWMAGRRAPDTRVWVDMGDHEGDTVQSAAELVEVARALATEHLPGRVAEVRLTTGAGHWHDEAAWAERFPEFLRWWLKGA